MNISNLQQSLSCCTLPQNPYSEDEKIEVNLTPFPGLLYESLFTLHRQIEAIYRSFSWPKKMTKIVILTRCEGGMGDIAAAAKIISFLQKSCPTLTFDWVVLDTKSSIGKINSFLFQVDRSKIQIRSEKDFAPDKTAADFLLAGPTLGSWEKKRLMKMMWIARLTDLFLFLPKMPRLSLIIIVLKICLVLSQRTKKMPINIIFRTSIVKA